MRPPPRARVTVTSPASGTLLNIAASTSTSADPTPANNNGSAAAARVTTVVNTADVVTTKTGPATANAGASITYTLTVRNAGAGQAAGILLVDTLPATATFVSASGGGVLGAGNVVTWPAIATLANGATTTRTVTVTTPASGTLLNIAASTSTSVDPTPANNNGSAAAARVSTVIQVADVVTTKAGPATVNGGTSYTYTITVRNAGPNAAPNIVVIDTLPATVTFVSASNAGVLGAGNVVTWPVLATLANGATTTRTVTVTAPAGGTLLNIAASTSGTTDPVPANNNGSLAAARVTTVVNTADLVTTKTGPATVDPGGGITYTITTQNLGPIAAANVVIRDTLPATVTFVSASNAGVLGAGNVVTWPAIASLANGASVARTVTVTAPASGTLLNIAASSSATTDPTRATTTAPQRRRVSPRRVSATDVVTTKTGPASATIGSSFSYAITVQNAGPVNALGVVVTDTLPAGLTFVSVTGGGTLSGNVVTWPVIASLANGASQAYAVTVSVPAAGLFTNIVASTAASGDLNSNNNNGSLPASRVTTTVLNQADVVDHEDWTCDGQRGPASDVLDHRGEQWPDGRGQRGGHRHATGLGDFRERHGGRHGERQRGDLAGDRIARQRREPGVQRHGDRARDGHAAGHRGEHVDHTGSDAGQQQWVAAGEPGQHHRGRAGGRGYDQDRRRDGERGDELLLYNRGGEHWPERGRQRGGDRHATGGRHVRECHGRRHVKRERGDLARDREPGQRRQPGLRGDGDGPGDRHAAQHCREHVVNCRSRTPPITTDRHRAPGSRRR